MQADTTTRRIVFFGDSRADWWHVPVLPGFQCIAAGVPGASAPYLARRFHAMVAPLRPDIVVVQMGVNDLAGLHPGSREVETVVAATRDAIVAVLRSARNLGAHVVVTTVFPLARGYLPDQVVQEAIKAVNAGLPSLAGEGVQVFDSAAVLAGANGYVLPAYADDELHLSPAGYAALNEALVPMLDAAYSRQPQAPDTN
jgi:lysophospholipase L1-like esterase